MLVAQNNEPTELERILALPSRAPVDCEREEGTTNWSPASQALVEVVTERFARPKRLSCGCQKRFVTALPNGRLLIFREGVPGQPPAPPLETTLAEFVADNAHDPKTCTLVSGTLPGKTLELPGLGRLFCVTELNPVQSWILRELPRSRGILGMISVGGGKTIASILAPLALECRTVVVLAKPDQRLHYKNAYLQLREHFRVPSIVFDKPDVAGSYIVPGSPVLHFVPYSLLSNPKSTNLLEQLEPDMVIADESHLLSARTSSRTMRFLRYMANRRDVVFCNWSGSIINKTLKDVSHLAAYSLGTGSPFPLMPSEVDLWSNVVDPVQFPDTKSDTADQLYRAFSSGPVNATGVASLFKDRTDLRQGLQRRIITTPGVISTVSSSVTASITIRKREVPELPAAVAEGLTGVRQDAVRPDGEELVEASEIALCARTVASGYHYYWAYPKGEPVEVIQRWFSARRAWNKELRRKLLIGEPHLDSPNLCANAAERAYRQPRYDGNLPVWPAEFWLEWAAVRDTVEPDPRVRWIDDFLARDAAAWARENKGIVWCQSSAFGRKVAELAGITYHGGGPEAEARILAEDGSRSIVASIKAHSESRDGLQFKFCKQLIAEVPSSGKGWEQLLGRLVRRGQQAETVETDIYLHVAENMEAFRKAMMYAQFIEATTGNKQMLLAADVEFEF